jgi:hypothetical protein
MSPVLGAVASVMSVFEGFEDRPKFTVPAGAERDGETGTGHGISRAPAEGKFCETEQSKKHRLKRAASDRAQAA